MIEMHNYAHAVNDGWIPDWLTLKQTKFGLTSHTCVIQTSVYNCLANDFLFGISVKSEELVKQMLKEFGPRLETLYNQQY